MKIAVISAQGRGETDRLITETAEQLLASGRKLSGIVKVLEASEKYTDACDMDVKVLPDGPAIRITQSLGDGAEGCRLNPEAITTAVAAVEARQADGADIFVLNKFGPQEAAGGGFRGAIAAALEQGQPVLVGVGPASRSVFEEFAAGMAEFLPDDRDEIIDWCNAALS